MFQYSYKSVGEDNRITSGLVSAWTSTQAKNKAAVFGTVIRVIRNSEIFSKHISLSFRAFSSLDRISFFRDMALMMTAGMSPIAALEVLSDQARTKKAGRLLNELRNDVENGFRLSEAMARQPELFSEIVVETVSVGEVTGELNEALDRIAEDLERDYELRRKVIGALAYPAVIIGVMLIVLSILILYVLPQIAIFTDQLGIDLPLPTRILIAIGTFFQSRLYVPLIALLLVIMGFYAAIKNDSSRYALHYALLKLPIYGELIKQYNLSRFFRSMESLYKSGISMLHGIPISEKTLTNDVYKRALQEILPTLSYGITLMEGLAPYPELFPPQIQRIVGVGEKTGKIEEAFHRITTHYERSLEHKTKTMSTLIEPILIVFVGTIIGGIAISIFLPIYQATMAVSQM